MPSAFEKYREYRHQKKLKAEERSAERTATRLRREAELEQVYKRQRSLEKSRRRLSRKHGARCDCADCKMARRKEKKGKSSFRMLLARLNR